MNFCLTHYCLRGGSTFDFYLMQNPRNLTIELLRLPLKI
jgi:hypothetical protein